MKPLFYRTPLVTQQKIPLVFHSDAEQKMFEEYKYLKGEDYHYYVAEQLKTNEYIKIAAAMQYDLKLKYILYRYICLFEEWIRALLMNAGVEPIDFFINGNADLGKEQSIYLKNVKTIQNTFPETKMLSNAQFNLVRKLRNSISHFTPLIFEQYDYYVSAIKNLKNVLPAHFVDKIQDDVNNCNADWPLPPGLKITI
ncbi:hypothetical protein [Williamsoniiplasma lucivorax]|uniref:Uncharacterized protein n=1 Tax=Williamsoniiplasma lucivorax TaxID=209274 RepID=A0A2S5RFK3_9MOLU|nr:hypothetical protein [Williamsoniiplasma lucivorax]PPE06104.1 hypothetical protein ELUCI_v1c03950 [Williamsoniiplasma lucivorax]